MTTNPGLAAIRRPADLRGLGPDELASLAAEIRGFLIRAVSRTGGHLGPNLGVVELTLALHRVFDSPQDALIWDTGHQAYVHKLLTGRQDGWERLKKTGGLSGYPSRAESEHDHVESSHASSSLSWADGIARANALTGRDRHVVAVVGDGALTGGMAWEALNNIAAGEDRNVVIVVNDNGRSYSPTIGGLADRLASLRLQPGYERILEAGKRTVRGTPVVGPALYAGLHAFKAGVKDALSPQELFSDLGLKYFGPVDGHDIAQVESALRRAKRFGGPVIVHAVTRKGNGYPPAENDEAEQMHSPSAFDPETGAPTGAPSTGWTDVFSEEVVELGARRTDVVAITAAMLGPTGLAPFGAAYPDRLIDVGIAEQHALTTAAGLSRAGMHPVVALYSTFLNRGFDQLMMDVGLHRERLTLMLDRSGVTGSDGPSHNGMWDLSILGIVPGMRVAAPRDEPTLREEFREAVAVSDGPTALRYPKGSVVASVPAVRRLDGPAGVDVLHEPADGRAQVLVVCVGGFGKLGVAAAKRLADQGVDVTVVDPRWVLPVPRELLTLAADHQLVVTVSDCGTHGGFGSALSDALRGADIDVRQRDLALPQEYLEHGSRDDVLAAVGLTEQDVARRITEWAAAAVPALPRLDPERTG
ncbi:MULTISPECIES: 1-deoxy-D-xylulose-5-phosphate synthase [unclassified Pseudonocardia]|uniref:1-deoxy-D-xylulose-5-phosphate synthase n=1 Tax=unclassified Pseudonocardia TaxID=2619320 RepID=UPI0001FFE5E8|nr:MULTISPECIES: 1-deoxy-D-xylulose-5-phosphate synthase [unclassified Pseudonocardia]ALE74012.1 1-deoxy-D-xylulose-5-phosphate synthase [Pseudonocardia sp. EC080625-04]ALL77420.1 1-deoxy-D-xylulose-5-phosphate synthase [Pseudonocardia sp. EC080610-09]ALL80335.1 1-deoxy-D-xylulose-5-phosphate synthase [Pseudonocardia sp. EC080619-01]OLM17900.1 1-deoxy-D-xylulose 5-phosphate synthase [Pseudonocardia sp. Ae707_Ps1]